MCYVSVFMVFVLRVLSLTVALDLALGLVWFGALCGGVVCGVLLCVCCGVVRCCVVVCDECVVVCVVSGL